MARYFSHWLKAYVDFTALSEAPLDFHFWTGVSTVAAVLRRRVWRDERLFKWTPNFYIIFVGPAGVVTKSTTLGLGYRLLQQVPGIVFGPDSMTWHGLAKRFEAAVEYVKYIDEKGVQKQILQSPLTCSISELGTFLRPDDKGLVSFLTDIWDGKERPFEHGTKDSGQIKIENPWLNLIGATTPEWMQNNFPANLIGEGIGSRTIFIYGEKKRHLTAYPSQAVAATDYSIIQNHLIDDLKQIATLSGPYDITPEALQWGTDWYARHYSKRPTHMASGRFSGYLARKQTHLHKLAMVLAASQRDELQITKDDLEKAEGILATAEHSMIKVFESVGIVDEAKHLAEIVTFVRTFQWITSSELYHKHCFNIMAKKDFSLAVTAACESQLLEVVRKDGLLGLSPKVPTKH